MVTQSTEQIEENCACARVVTSLPAAETQFLDDNIRFVCSFQGVNNVKSPIETILISVLGSCDLN